MRNTDRGGLGVLIAGTCLATLLLLSGCAATVEMATPELDQAAKTYVPPEGQANIYVTRKDQFTGSAVLFQVVVDGQMLGAIAPGTYHMMSVEPGRHVIAATSMENQTSQKIEAEAGHCYFFEVTPKTGWMAARVDVQPMSETEGRAAVSENSLAEGFESD